MFQSVSGTFMCQCNLRLFVLNYQVIFPGVGAFDHLFGPGRGEFEKKISKNSNARGVTRRGGGEGRKVETSNKICKICK